MSLVRRSVVQDVRGTVRWVSCFNSCPSLLVGDTVVDGRERWWRCIGDRISFPSNNEKLEEKKYECQWHCYRRSYQSWTSSIWTTSLSVSWWTNLNVLNARSTFTYHSRSDDLLSEIITGLKSYFDKSLGNILLYRFERQQYTDLKRQNSELVPSDVYGAEHLLRLFGMWFFFTVYFVWQLWKSAFLN